MTRVVLAFTAVLFSAAALAQDGRPYAGLEQRTVKALSEQQIGDLRAGRGMGLALPAELNGYPGPSHVLENSDALALSPEQRERTRTLFEAMKAETMPIGERLIEQETTLDRLFADRQINLANLRAATEEIGVTQGRLRQAHLKYHLAMMDVLTPDQIARYRALRGYEVGHDGARQHQMQH